MPSSKPESESLFDGEPISPELVLVSPELRKRARALLREPSPEPPTAPRARPSPPPIPAIPPRPRRPADAGEAATTPPVTPSARPRSRLAPAVALATGIVLFSVGVAVGTSRPSDAPVLLQEGGGATTAATTSAEPSVATSAATSSGVLGTQTTKAGTRTRGSTRPRPAATTSARARARSRRAAPLPFRPIAGGYMWARGSFLATGAVNRVEQFELTTACETILVVPPMTVDANASFRFRGRLRAAGRGASYSVEVTGRWISKDAVRGSVRYSSASCARRSAAYVARPSCQPLEPCAKSEDVGDVRP